MSDGQDQTVKELLEQNRELMKMLANRSAAETAPAPATAVQAAPPQQVAQKPWAGLTRLSNGAVPVGSIGAGLPAGLTVAIRVWIDDESYDVYAPLQALAELSQNPQGPELLASALRALKQAEIPVRSWAPDDNKKRNRWNRR